MEFLTLIIFKNYVSFYTAQTWFLNIFSFIFNILVNALFLQLRLQNLSLMDLSPVWVLSNDHLSCSIKVNAGRATACGRLRY